MHSNFSAWCRDPADGRVAGAALPVDPELLIWITPIGLESAHERLRRHGASCSIRARSGGVLYGLLVMGETSEATVSRLLAQLEAGDGTALKELYPLIYNELLVLARRQRRRLGDNFTLTTTALVNESYLKLVGQKQLRPNSRSHLLAIAAKAMRHILANYNRQRRSKKRGGDFFPVPLEQLDEGEPRQPLDEGAGLLDGLEQALQRLEAQDKRLSDVVECRFFGAMSIEDTAQALGMSPATVKRRWVLARTWLYREMQGGR